jgi:hypothetical protein
MENGWQGAMSTAAEHIQKYVSSGAQERRSHLLTDVPCSPFRPGTMGSQPRRPCEGRGNRELDYLRRGLEFLGGQRSAVELGDGGRIQAPLGYGRG